jgi:hypothetical protein
MLFNSVLFGWLLQKTQGYGYNVYFFDLLAVCSASIPIQPPKESPNEPEKTEELLKKLMDEELVEMLKNPHLRAVIRDICIAADPVVALDKKMLTDEAALKPFYDVCLRLISKSND